MPAVNSTYIHILNVLYQLGIFAQCRLVKLQSKKAYPSFDVLLMDNVSKIADKQYEQRDVINAINKYISWVKG